MVSINYFQTEPNDEFLGGAVSTKELCEWIRSTGAALPPTPQHLDFVNIDYVGVRNYLDELSSEVVNGLSSDRIVHEAIQLLIANPEYPCDMADRDLILNYSALEPARLNRARWLLNRDTWSEWRNLIREGLDVGKLALINGRTRKAIPWPGALNQKKNSDQSAGGAEPIATEGFSTEVQVASASPPVKLAPVAIVEMAEPDGIVRKSNMLTTRELAETFAGLNGWSDERWIKNLSSSKWSHGARVAIGAAGGASSAWNPLTLAQLMHGREKDVSKNKKMMDALRSRFAQNPVLRYWCNDFNEYYETHCITE